jgi:RNA polymerase sigma-70 factor, ECF subfamily
MAASGPFPEDGEEPDEDVLVAAATAGDQAAFRTLWRASERRAYALCVRLTGNRADAADALQEAQIAVWRNLHRFEGRCPFGAWVYAVARNAALALVRARGRRPEDAVDEVPDRPRDTGGAPFADVVVETMTVRAALEELPDKHREALLLWVGGLTYAQVAELMGSPVNSVRVWIHRARGAMRSTLAH